MTKIKKTLALLMVLVMAMTMMTLPASAAEIEEEVEPCIAIMECGVCGGVFRFVQHCDVIVDSKVEEGVVFVRYQHYDVYSCETCGYTHHVNITEDLYWSKY